MATAPDTIYPAQLDLTILQGTTFLGYDLVLYDDEGALIDPSAYNAFICEFRSRPGNAEADFTITPTTAAVTLDDGTAAVAVRITAPSDETTPDLMPAGKYHWSVLVDLDGGTPPTYLCLVRGIATVEAISSKQPAPPVV